MNELRATATSPVASQRATDGFLVQNLRSATGSRRLDGKLGWCFAALATLGAAGCAMDSTDGSDELPVQATSRVSELVAGANVPNPDSSYFASVGAVGTGCPPGSVSTVISDDGREFTMTFSSYRAELVPNAASVTKDCQLLVQLHSPRGLSYTVSSFSYSGVASLDPGISANLSAYYYFQGLPVPPSDRDRKVMTGPFNDTFSFDDEIRTVDQVWSPCGVDRALNVRTRLQVVSGNNANGNGSVQVATAEGKTTLRFGLAWRMCS